MLKLLQFAERLPARTDYQPGKAGYSLVAPNHQGPQKPQITCETNTLW